MIADDEDLPFVAVFAGRQALARRVQNRKRERERSKPSLVLLSKQSRLFIAQTPGRAFVAKKFGSSQRRRTNTLVLRSADIAKFSSVSYELSVTLASVDGREFWIDGE